MIPRVLRLQEINLNKINYVKIKNLDNKKQIYIDYENKPLVFQCPTLLNDNLPIKITDDYYELEIPLITQEKNKQNSLIDFLKNIDSKISEDANNNVKLWFNENNMSYFFKTIVKDSEKYKKGSIKLKIIKTIKFESILLENNKQININDIQKDWWVKILLEIHSIIINHDNKTFYLFIRPHAFSFKNKEITSNYNFLEDSDSNEEIPDSDINNLFLKQSNNKSNEKQTSSQINYKINQINELSKSNFSTTSSEKKISNLIKNLSDTKEKSPKKLSDSDKENSPKKLLDSDEEIQDLKKLSDSTETSTDSDKSLKKLSDSTDSEGKSLKKLSDSTDSSTDSEGKSLKKLSDSTDSSTDSEGKSLKKLSDSTESSTDNEGKSLKLLNFEECSTESNDKLSDSEESIKNKKENDNLKNSITLASILERDKLK